VNPETCGFAKVAAFNAAKESRAILKEKNSSKSQELQETFKLFCDALKEHSNAQEIDFQTFVRRFPYFEAVIKKWNPRKKAEKDTYFAKFSSESWTNLSQAKKREHSFSNCKGCYQNYADIQALFPVRSPNLKKKAKNNPFNVVKELQSNSKLNPVSKRIAINGASLLYEKLNPAFEKWSGIPLGEALSKVPEAKVEVKKSAGERKNVRRNIMRAAKDKVETQWKETALQRYM